MQKLLIWLGHPWIPLMVALLAVILTFPSLWNGLNLDDNAHSLILLKKIPGSKDSLSPLDLFRASSDDAQLIRQAMNFGFHPWWTPEKFKYYLFRPLSSLSHMLDYHFWPDSPLLMHLQSLVWFSILVFLAALFYRRMLGSTWVAGLAALFFALDDAHGMAAGWIASRNALIPCVFGVLCLIFHDRWRRENWQSGTVLSPACLALALLSAESATATGAYLLAYALFLERGSWRNRLASLLPYGVVLFLWRLMYDYLGCGIEGFPIYTDPVKDPLLYLVALFYRAPAYLLAQWALPPLFVYMVWPSLIHKAGLILTGVLALILTPLLRKDRVARFWAAGMLMSLLPICAVMPQDRLLFFVGLGAMGLLAQWIQWADQIKWNLKSRLWRIAISILLVFFILIHGVLAPVCLPITARVSGQIEKQIVRANSSLPSGPAFKEQKFVLVNTPIYSFFVRHLLYYRIRMMQEQVNPLQVLTAGNHPLVFTRKDLHTIEVRSVTGSLTDFETVAGSKNISMSQGQKIELDDMIIEVLEVKDGLPSAAGFRFSLPLEDANLLWFRWQDGEYVPFRPPAIGETITIEGAKFTMG